MSRKEIKQVSVFEELKRGEITQKQAGIKLKLSVRQVRNKQRRYETRGAEGLIHQSRGRPSPRKTPNDVYARIVAFIKKYPDFGPTFTAEKLNELKAITINKETVRQIQIKEGIRKPRRRKPKHRTWRPPKEHYGEMMQFDGSEHDWLEDRGPKAHLLLFIDDATKIVPAARFYDAESTKNVMCLSKEYFSQHGLPASIYSDKGSVYRVNVNNPDNEKETQFKRACNELGIELLNAHSAQAKGRVERCFGTFQDRLIKEMRLAGISNYVDANRFLQEIFLPMYNKRWTREPAQPADLHMPVSAKELKNSLCIKQKRVIMNDFTVQYKNQLYQLLKQQKAVIRPKESVKVFEHLNGDIELWIRGIKLNWRPIEQRAEKPLPQKRQPKPCKPVANHPWRQYHRTSATLGR